MTWHFSVHKFLPLCRPGGANEHIMTTPDLGQVNCDQCRELVINIAKQAGEERLLKETPMASKVKRIQVWRGKSGAWYWHSLAGNHKMLFAGGEGFSHKGRTIKFVQAEWPTAKIEVLDAQGAVTQVIDPLVTG